VLLARGAHGGVPRLAARTGKAQISHSEKNVGSHSLILTTSRSGLPQVFA
jgi:hypothetical protein